MSFSHLRTGELRAGDRTQRQEARDLLFRNAPDQVFQGEMLTHGATPNISSSDGSILTFKPQYGGGSLQSAHTFVPAGYAGIASDAGAALLANAGRQNTRFANDSYGARQSTLAAQELTSVLGNVRHGFNDAVEAFGDIMLMRNEGRGSARVGPARVVLAASAPNNPFQQEIEVAVPETGWETDNVTRIDQYRATAGLIFRLSPSWTAALDYARGESETKTKRGTSLDEAGEHSLETGLAADDGWPALDVLAPLDFAPYLTPSPGYDPGMGASISDLNLRLSGEVLRWRGGSVTTSLLAEQRWERLLDSRAFGVTFEGAAQRVRSAYGEINVPLIGSDNAYSWVQAFDVRASIRHDEYRTEAPGACCPPGSRSINRAGEAAHMIGVRYQPSRSVTLRASFGTGFLPASVTQIVGSDSIGSAAEFGTIDPKRGETPLGDGQEFLVRAGGSTDLKPEHSRSFTVGAILTPSVLPGLRVSADYTRIRKRDEISPAPIDFILENPHRFPGRVVRAPLTDADRALGYTGGVLEALDLSLVNLARTEVEAFDAQVDYRLDTRRWGAFSIYMVGTYQPTFDRQTLPGDPFVNEAGYGELLRQGRTAGVFNKIRYNVGLDWESGALRIGGNAQYYSSYEITSPQEAFDGGISNTEIVRKQGSGVIPSQVYVDPIASFDFSASARFGRGRLDGMEISAGIENVFDTAPKLFAEAHREYYSTIGDPRMRRFQIGIKKSF